MNLHIDPSIHSLISKTQLPTEWGFGKFFCPFMIKGLFQEGSWQFLELQPYKELSLDPAAMVFHYGQTIFEGLKAYRGTNGLNLFRPLDHAHRFNRSAERLAMPPFPVESFLESVVQFSSLATPLVPEGDNFNLYLRPFMIASQVGLGVRPANSYLFLLIGSPSGNYFSAPGGVKVMIERQYRRAASPGGTGSVKTAGNYASSLLSDRKIKAQGFHQSLWLDSMTGKYIEEMTGMNFFAVIDNCVVTPPLSDSILAGITRDSIIYLAGELGLRIEERPIPINELTSQMRSGLCSECFISGTAAGITAVELLGEADGTVYPLKAPDGPVTTLLRQNLKDLQRARRPAPEGWIVSV